MQAQKVDIKSDIKFIKIIHNTSVILVFHFCSRLWVAYHVSRFSGADWLVLRETDWSDFDGEASVCEVSGVEVEGDIADR